KKMVDTKRELHTILKATVICALEPNRAAQIIVDGGFTKEYRYALQAMKDVSYSRWREFDAEDSVRFYALSLHDIGMIKTSPNKIIAQETDWRVIKGLKKKVKG